ncbi:MAG: response regulator [bacterium]
MARILIVEDDCNTRVGLSEILSEEGYDIVAVETAEAALERIETDIDILLSDLRLPCKSGLELVKEFKSLRPALIAIIMTAYSTPECYIEGKDIGVEAWLTKPLNVENLLSLLKKTQSSVTCHKERQIPQPETVLE